MKTSRFFRGKKKFINPEIKNIYWKSLEDFINLCKCEKSEWMKVNKYAENSMEMQYIKHLDEYMHKPAKSISDFFDANTWWKLHLNVEPKNVSFVSEYLKNNWYTHKFLKWWDIADGKIFTIYIWSRSLTNRCAQSISQDIWSTLCKPKALWEAEFAPGVVGRFVDQQCITEFWTTWQYGTAGFSEVGGWRYQTAETQILMRKASFEALKKKHGAYFVGN